MINIINKIIINSGKIMDAKLITTTAKVAKKAIPATILLNFCSDNLLSVKLTVYQLND